ncbi:MAG TPA: class I SAM-dependent methyltransferase [Candidatus Hydrogenedens sp.]|nr:class I SAM-dependent methyltransferase [Candidatus Hydrogenedens sp.]
MNLFDKFADNYDEVRKGSAPYLFSILSVLKQSQSQNILDLGCGTGNLFQELCRYQKGNFIGLDVSEKMIRKAKAKKIPADWICASAENIPFQNNSFDSIVGIYTLHLFKNIPQVLSECRRVLNRGWVLFVSAPYHFIVNHPLNQFFPSFSKMDLSRFPTEEQIEDMLLHAGFSNLKREYYAVVRDWLSEEYIQKVKSKFISTLQLIPDDEFNEGIKKMRETTSNTSSGKPIPWESVLIMGFAD